MKKYFAVIFVVMAVALTGCKSGECIKNVSEYADAASSEEKETAEEAESAEEAEAAEEAAASVEAEAEPTADTSPSYELVGADMVAFRGFGGPQVSSYIAIKNTGDYPITFSNARFEYQDRDGNLLTVDDMVNCIPEAIKPGQVGYIYSYYHDLDGVDLSNGLKFEPDAAVRKASGLYEMEVSEVSFKPGSILDVKVTARGTNKTGEDRAFTNIGAVFYDKDDKVVGFCYGYENFPNGKGTAFEISGDVMSEDYDPDIVDHVEVFIQGNDLF